jgi:hypothetical protein
LVSRHVSRYHYYAEHQAYPLEINSNWFHGKLANPYDPHHPTPVYVANTGNIYPTHKTIRLGSVFWYNRANGRFAARVAPQPTDAETIALFNRVNQENIVALDQKN